ncbi:MAG: hypothetical protein K5848_08510 [Lachnospiraceae bacterium]|nr:hypothetical protein [Lachnospiraceae bacterium]
MKKNRVFFWGAILSVVVVIIVTVIVVNTKKKASENEGEFTYTQDKMKFENVYRIDMKYWKSEPPLGLSITNKDDIEGIISRLNSLNAKKKGKVDKHSGGADMELQIFTDDREYQYMIDVHPGYIETGFYHYLVKGDGDGLKEYRDYLADYFEKNYDESKDFMKSISEKQ